MKGDEKDLTVNGVANFFLFYSCRTLASPKDATVSVPISFFIPDISYLNLLTFL